MKAEIKKEMIAAMKARDTQRRDVIKLIVGDVEVEETRQGRDLTAEECQKIIRKMVKSNADTLANTKDEGQIEKLKYENDVFAEFLPQTLSVEQIVEALAGVVDDIKAAGNDGQATGVAMKTLKSTGAAVEGKDVAAAVKQLRA